MKRLSSVLCLAVLFFATAPQLFAAPLSNTLIRLDPQAPNSALSGLVCATPTSTATEGNVSLTFPSDFSLSSNLSNWTTSSTDLPSGTLPWPGISSSAVTISGKVVTFSSGDLTAGIRYCFHFSSPASTTSASAGNKLTTVTTQTATGTAIDSTVVSIPLSANSVTVNGIVGAKPTDFQVDLVSQDQGDTFAHDTVLSYAITYGSSLTYPASSLTVQASWSQGTIEGTPLPTLDILNYYSNSATDAYNNTPAIIDPVNRTISWTISNFPAGLQNQKVYFKLKTNNAYNGKKRVLFTISARVIGPATQTPDASIQQMYLWGYNRPATGNLPPTETPILPSIAPPLASVPFQIDQVAIRSLSFSQATVLIETSKEANILLRYGTSSTNLNQTITALPNVKTHIFTIDDLKPQTQYYFRISATDTSGKEKLSDLYTFTTAKISQQPSVDPHSIIITSNNLILGTAEGLDDYSSVMSVVPAHSLYNFRFNLLQGNTITSVQSVLRDKYVLGITSDDQEVSTERSLVAELKPGVFQGKLLSPDTPGWYTLFARIADASGNVVEEKIADIRVIPRLTIKSHSSKAPIEHARVFLSLFNEQKQVYEDISEQVLPIHNPSFSDSDGTVDLILPEGMYKAKITAIGYDPQEIEFSISTTPQDTFPEVQLDPQPFNVITLLHYYTTTIGDGLSNASSMLQSISLSQRFFDLTAAITFASLICLSLLSFSAKTHIGIDKLPWLFVLVGKSLFQKQPQTACIRGEITDEDGIPLSGAHIYIIDGFRHKIIVHPQTDLQGKFHAPLLPAKQYKLAVTKKGYESLPLTTYTKDILSSHSVSLTLAKQIHAPTILEYVLDTFRNLFGLSFEVLLSLSLISELLFGLSLGFAKVFPFLILSLLNVLWYFLYRKRLHPVHAHE